MSEDSDTQRGLAQEVLRRFAGPGAKAADPDLSRSSVKAKIERLDQYFAMTNEKAPERTAARTEAQQEMMRLAEQALQKLAAEGERARLSAEEQSGIEVVLATDGTRPSLFVQGDDVDLGAGSINAGIVGNWRADILARITNIRTVVRSVGRVEKEGGQPSGPIGTAFVIAPRLVLTNKHVLADIAFRNAGQWVLEGQSFVNFAAEFDSTRERRFPITGVRFASADIIPRTINPRLLDVAILEVADDGSLPAALPLLAEQASVENAAEVYLVGYPMRSPGLSPSEMERVFGRAVFSVKRLAPGLVLQGPSTFQDGNTPNRVFTHDCSSLRGSSGSVVVEMFDGGRNGVGLHFGGDLDRRANFAHALARLRPLLEAEGATFASAGS